MKNAGIPAVYCAIMVGVAEAGASPFRMAAISSGFPRTVLISPPPTKPILETFGAVI